MPKLTGERPVIRISTYVYEEDWLELDSLTTPELNKSALVRRIIHTFVVQAKARVRTAIDRSVSASADLEAE